MDFVRLGPAPRNSVTWGKIPILPSKRQDWNLAPHTGKFVARFREKADRLYVADVFGDWREEIIVLNGNELHVYSNPAKNPRPGVKRRWAERNYRRLKQCHNYYSP